MKVLIDIAGFVNRGDQLMFSAIAQAVHAHLPDAELVVPHKLLDRPELRRLSDLPFRALADSRKLGRRVTNGLKWTLSHLGLCAAPVRPSQIDLVLHAPGFRYSDAFPLRRKDSLKKEVAYFRAFSKLGRKVVFLPQAFGPFETDGARRRMEALYPFADTLYARDTTSLAYLKELFPNAANVSLAPDFTCACRGVMPGAALDTGGGMASSCRTCGWSRTRRSARRPISDFSARWRRYSARADFGSFSSTTRARATANSSNG